MNRTSFLVDGFNLYHGMIEASARGEKPPKWLNVRTLCETYLPAVTQRVGERAQLKTIFYFSASPTHCAQDRISRHTQYMRCLRGTGVTVQLGRFKVKDRHCPKCCQWYKAHEEKESDVAIAARLFEMLHRDETDTVAMVTGDTDLAPALVSCKQLFPEKLVFFAFPPARRNADLVTMAPESFTIKLRTCAKNQFPDPLVLSDGTELKKPPTW